MNKLLLFCFSLFCATVAKAQTTYYWVGGKDPAPALMNTLANWNTMLDGSGTARASNTGADILVFDGTNYGGTTFTTGTDSVAVNGTVNCVQLRFVNGAKIFLNRTATTTGTITIIGDGTVGTDDFLIVAGSSLTITGGAGSVVILMQPAATPAPTNSGRVSGDFSMITGQQARIASGLPAGPTLVFTPGSTFTTNITSGTTAYAFGTFTATNQQSTEKWVTFQAGSTLYYDGGYSPMGSSSTYQPINFLPGSYYTIRATNPTTAFGTFTNRKAFANVVVQNNSTFTADGSINRIDTLTIASGAMFALPATGQTSVVGDVIVNGTLNATAASTNELMLTGNVLQTVSGSGTIALPSLVVADSAAVVLGRSVSVAKAAVISGRIDFGVAQLTGAGTFTAKGATANTTGTGSISAGNYIITGVTGATGLARGITVKGAGLAAGTRITGYTAAFDSIYISRPALATATNVALTFGNAAATLATGNTSGFDATTGSVVVADVKTYNDGISYVINAATATPFGITTGSGAVSVAVSTVLFNAAVTTNASAQISGSLQAVGKTTIRPLDTLRLLNGATLNGTYSNSNYFVTDVSGTNTGVLRRDNISGSNLFPVGSATNYLPATLNPISASDFAVNVFQGITANGQPTGTALTSLQKQTVVDAVWNINRVAGNGDANLQLQWTPQLEGTTLATFANTEIGIIKNTGITYTLPFGVGDNAANKADTTFSTFGQFSVGARPPANPFVFNTLPPKTYGDADFSAGVISSNTTTGIAYTSSNTAVATVSSGGTVHIVGVGTTIITAQQATDGFYPAANVSQTLTVNKAPLTIKADRKIKPEGDPNPPLTAIYTGFVAGETTAVLLTPAALSTTATTASPPGNYLITVSGATAANYAITFVNDSLIVRPRTAQTVTFAAFAAKTYGAADFPVGASSTNGTIPLAYTSSNTSVATIVGNNVHIVGAGTTNITVSQAGSDLFFPAAPVTQTLVVNKAPLTISVLDTTKAYGEANPRFAFRAVGFVLGETPAVFTAQPTVQTTATTNSAPGYYTLTPTGAVAANYNITYVSGRLTIYPPTGTGRTNLQAFMPNSGTLTVRVYSPAPDLGDVLIYDLNGRVVRRKNLFMPQGFISTNFAVGGMPTGIYVVQIVAKNSTLKMTVPILR